MKAILIKDSKTNEQKENSHATQSNKNAFAFSLKSIYFNEDYIPSNNTRTTTNFANLARGESRKENLRNTIDMIDNRFNSLANWDNPNSNRKLFLLLSTSKAVDQLFRLLKF